MMKTDWIKKQLPQKNKIIYLLIFLFCGMMLMIFPNNQTNTSTQQNPTNVSIYSIENEEKRLEEILSCINGAGQCKVLLSIHSGEETVLAEDNGETVVLSNGGVQSTVPVQTRYPAFQGAVIVSGGADDTAVRYDILSSVMAYTGLTVDRITICPIKVN